MKKKFMCGILTFMAASILTGFTMTASADTDRWDSTTARDANGDICVTFPDLTVTLPADWAGSCQMGTSEDEVAFYQTRSRQLYTEEFGYPSGGWLFSICFSEDTSFKQYASWQPLAQVSDGYYFVSFPTDVQGYLDDQEAMDEYCDMADEVEWVTDNIAVTREDAVLLVFDDEYIFPQSSAEYMTETDLCGMTADEVQMAINEIYARHGRKFVLQEVQAYFDSKSWYAGVVEAADFDVNVMSQIEGANIDLMLKYMKTAPTESSGETVSLMYTDSYEAVDILVF